MIITYSTSKKKKKQEEEDIAPVKQTENKNKSTNTGFGSIGVLPTIKKSANVFLGNSTKEKAKEVFNNSNLGRTKNAIQGLFSDGYDFGDVTKSILLARSNLNRTLNPGYKIGENIAKTGEKIYTDIKEGKGNEYIQNAKPIQNIKSRFSDGWDAGDVTKSILDVNKLALGTSADILANLAKGELQTAEGLVDTGRYVVSDVAKLAGADKLSAYAKQNAIQNTTGFIFGENDSQNNMKENGWLSKLDQYSLFGNQMDNIIQSVGQQGFRYGLATAGKMTGLGETGEKILNNVEIFAGSYGSAKSQAYMQGADDKTATVRGIISGTAEWVSEHLDENPFLKTGSVTSKLKGNIVKGIEKTFGSELMGKIALAAMSAESEDFEERLSNALETMGTDIYNYIDADYKYGLEEGQGLDKNASAWDNVKKLLDDAFKAGTNEEAQQSAEAAKWSTLLTFGLSQGSTKINKNQAINAVAKENNITKEQATKIYDAVLEARKSEVIDSTTDYNDKYNIETQLSNELSAGVKQGTIDLQELNELYKDKNKLEKAVGTGLVTSEGLNLVDSYKAYKGDDGNLQNVKNAQRLLDDRNINGRFDATYFRSNDVNSIWSTDNGQDSAIFNPNASSKTIFQEIVMHELYHDVKNQNTKLGKTITKDILDLAQKSANYEKFRAELEKTYENVYDKNSGDFSSKIDEEIVANELAKNLGTQEYINRLIGEKPTTAERIYNWVKDKLDNLGKTQEYKQEKIFWKSVADKFEVAYNEQKKNIKFNDKKYSLINDKYANLNETQQDRVNEADKLKEKGYNDDYIWKKTGVKFTEDGHTLYADNLHIKDVDKLKTLDKNVAYNIKDYFNSDLFSNYPTIRNLKFMIIDFENAYKNNGVTDLEELKKARNTIAAINDEGNLFINSTKLNDINKNIDIINYHEVQHIIQTLSGDKVTTNISDKRLNDMMHINDEIYQYRNNPIEIEAEVNRVLSSMTKEQRRAIPFSYVEDIVEQHYQSSNKNLDINDAINKIKSKMWYDINGGEDEKGSRIQTKNSSNVERIQNHTNTKNDNSQGNNVQQKKNENANRLYGTKQAIDIKEDNEQSSRNNGDVDNTSFSLKQKQLDIIQKNNPVNDDYHTWIRNIDDIKTLEETLQDEDWADYDEINPDLSKQDLLDAIDKGKIIVYSSYPIEQGIFVSPSKMEAQSYSGDGKIYSKEVNINDVAWIDPTQGQYAKVDNTITTLNTNVSKYLTSNLNPTTNEDIRYLLEKNQRDEQQDISPVTKGTRTTMGELFTNNEIAPIREDISSLTEKIDNLSNQLETLQNQAETRPRGYVETYNQQRFENEGYNALTEEDANVYQDALMNDEGYLESLDEQANLSEDNTKLVDKLTRNISERLDLEKSQKDTLRGIIQKSIENDYTADEISNELYKEFSELSYDMTDQEATNAKRLIRDIPIKVSDAIKMDIPDYGKWKSSNFGKINFSNSGSPVDSVYAELNEVMPYYFPADIVNPSDQLLKIAEVANMANKVTETIDIDADEFDDIADYIKNTKLDDEYNALMKGEYDLNKNIQFNMSDDIAPTTIRTQESIDDFIENRDIAPVRETNENKRQQRIENREKLETMKREIQEKFINRNYVLDQMAKATGNEDIKFAGDNLNNVSAEAQFNVTNKQTDANGNWLGAGVNELFLPSKQQGLYEPFNDYLVQKSNIERHAVGKGSQVPLEVSKQLVAQYEKQFPVFKEWAKPIYKYQDNSLIELYDTGVVSKELYETLRGENGMYRSHVPFYQEQIDTSRYFDNEGKLKPVNALKRAKGGANDVSQLLSIEDAMARQTYAVKKAIRQNELYKQIVASSEKFNDIGDLDIRNNPTDMESSFYITEDGDKILSAYINGEKVSAKISDEVYNELMKTNENNIKQIEDSFSLITNPLQKLSNARRKILTTWNPTFLARNAIKDVQDAVINSKHTTDMLKNYFGVEKGSQSAIFELRDAKTKEAQQFLALYGTDNTYGDYSKSGKNKLINSLSRANELIELAPRFAEFKASLQNGESVEQAIYNAREVTTNFGRGGYITKALNRNGFTFLNANVQGLDKAIRNLTGQNGVKGVTYMVVKGAAFSVLPSILNHLLFGIGDDKDEEYEALPDYIKDNYYLIKLESGDTEYDTSGNVISYGSGKFVRIPKGRITSVFGSFARRTMEGLEGEENPYENYLSNAWSQIGVGDLGGNNIISPIMQAQLFKNDKNHPGEAWYGGDIVPTRLQNKPAAEQTDASIDAISNFIGETFNISPYKVNYVIDQYSGGIGDVLLPMITQETTSGAETPIEYLTAPIKDSFIVNSTDDNKYAGEFYKTKDKLEITKNGMNATDDDILQYKYMSNISTQMSDLYKEKREVQADVTLSNKEKYAKVQAIQNEINSLAKQGLMNYKETNSTDNYSSIGDEEYYKDANNEWKQVTEADAEFTSGLNTSEKDSYYRTKNKISEVTQEYNNLSKGLDKNSPQKLKYASQKRFETTQAIINSGLDNYTKAMLYSKYYSDKETMTNVVNAKYDVDTYMTALYDIEELRNKYSQSKGYTTEQRKKKTIAYINSLNMEIPQKAMLLRKYYSSFRYYNNDIVNYVSNLDISYEEKVSILEDTGMKVNGNRVTWK